MFTYLLPHRYNPPHFPVCHHRGQYPGCISQDPSFSCSVQQGIPAMPPLQKQGYRSESYDTTDVSLYDWPKLTAKPVKLTLF